MPHTAIIPGRPSATALTWLVLADKQAPHLTLEGPSSSSGRLVTHSLIRPGHSTSIVPWLVSTQNLQPNSVYRLRSADTSASSTTLPANLSPDQPFSIAFGSCYCYPMDKGIAAQWTTIKEFGLDNPLRLRILCGDQIYMDLDDTSGSPISSPPDPWSRYKDLWSSTRYNPFLTSVPNLMLADDHEFWNDYPHSNVWLKWDEGKPGGPLGIAMDRTFAVYQAALNLDPNHIRDNQDYIDHQLDTVGRSFKLDIGPIQIFLLDTRTRRTRYDSSRPHFTDPSWLSNVLQWLDNLTAPGILVISQPLIESQASWLSRVSHTMGDVNLPDYEEDFATIWEHLNNAAHDVLILSGDIHWSRLYQVKGVRNTLWEFVSSPISRIPDGLVGEPGLGEERGKVKWSGTPGYLDWICHFQHNERQMYGTFTVIPKRGSADTSLSVRATIWGLSRDVNRGAVALATHSFDLS